MCQVDFYGWVHFDEPERAESAKATLEEEGYRAELRPQEDGAVIVLAIPPEASLPPQALTTRLRSLAADFGGEFIGHGGSEQVVLRGAFLSAGAGCDHPAAWFGRRPKSASEMA